jgi:glycosyltransferase involved in cell wall biosynthesis
VPPRHVSASGHLPEFLSTGRRRAARTGAILRNAHQDPVIRGRPLVSVVLSTYNWSSVLRYSVRSVLRQTYPNLELLVIGDGCTDDSEHVVASFGDERVRWHNLETNSGSQATPNNVGLKMARGEYIAYQGHDDVWHPRHLATMLAHLQAADAEFGNSLSEVLGPPGTKVRFVAGLFHEDESGVWIPPAAIVHRTELGRQIGGWRTWQEGAIPDIDFFQRLRERGTRLSVFALTVFKFPSTMRPNAYRERPSYEQEAYSRRIARERLFVERELAALAWRWLSPTKGQLPVEPTDADLADAMSRFAYFRRVRGLD